MTLLCCCLVQAVVKFNLQRVLGDPTGEQDRPLVVRRANMRKPAAALMPGGAAGLQAAAAGLSPNSAFSSASSAGGNFMSMSSSHPTAMELQQQGSIGQMGLGGGPDTPYYLQPLAAIQVRVGVARKGADLGGYACSMSGLWCHTHCV